MNKEIKKEKNRTDITCGWSISLLIFKINQWEKKKGGKVGNKIKKKNNRELNKIKKKKQPNTVFFSLLFVCFSFVEL